MCLKKDLKVESIKLVSFIYLTCKSPVGSRSGPVSTIDSVSKVNYEPIFFSF